MSSTPPPKVRRPRPSRGPRDAVTVMPAGDGWQVVRADLPRADTFATQDEAVRAAKAMTRAAGGQLSVHGRDGRIRDSLTLGRLAFEKISAVEGIRLSDAMKRDLRDADAGQASPEDARRAIAAKYGKERA